MSFDGRIDGVRASTVDAVRVQSEERGGGGAGMAPWRRHGNRRNRRLTENERRGKMWWHRP